MQDPYRHRVTKFDGIASSSGHSRRWESGRISKRGSNVASICWNYNTAFRHCCHVTDLFAAGLPRSLQSTIERNGGETVTKPLALNRLGLF